MPSPVPADRAASRFRLPIEPPGEAKEDFWLLNELARRIGANLAEREGLAIEESTIP